MQNLPKSTEKKIDNNNSIYDRFDKRYKCIVLCLNLKEGNEGSPLRKKYQFPKSIPFSF